MIWVRSTCISVTYTMFGINICNEGLNNHRAGMIPIRKKKRKQKENNASWDRFKGATWEITKDVEYISFPTIFCFRYAYTIIPADKRVQLPQTNNTPTKLLF